MAAHANEIVDLTMSSDDEADAVDAAPAPEPVNVPVNAPEPAQHVPADGAANGPAQHEPADVEMANAAGPAGGNGGNGGNPAAMSRAAAIAAKFEEMLRNAPNGFESFDAYIASLSKYNEPAAAAHAHIPTDAALVASRAAHADSYSRTKRGISSVGGYLAERAKARRLEGTGVGPGSADVDADVVDADVVDADVVDADMVDADVEPTATDAGERARADELVIIDILTELVMDVEDAEQAALDAESDAELGKSTLWNDEDCFACDDRERRAELVVCASCESVYHASCVPDAAAANAAHAALDAGAEWICHECAAAGVV